jgi:5'-nucleotidase
MHILLTNDDGIYAPGLLALADVLGDVGNVTILAPDRNWSASGHVKTMHRPLRVTKTQLANGVRAYTTDGAPSDCVALAILGFFEEPINLVVSGINPHANVGHDVTYSGTVTAAMEAAISGIPGIAFSLDAPVDFQGELDFRSSAEVALRITQQIARRTFPDGLLLNINIPYRPFQELHGIQITHQGQRVYRDKLVKRSDPRRRPYYWIGGDAPTGVPESGSDVWALAEGYVSITPLQLDLTAHDQKKMLIDWKIDL